jgi:putative transposase
MPRPRRFAIAGQPLHLVQRGNNRTPTFLVPGDFVTYLHLLGEALPHAGCSLHAYALMGNHVHLLLTPDAIRSASILFHQVGSRYVHYFNKRHGRTGTLWEGRFRSCLIDSDAYLLRCHRYIERNPVRAGLVDEAADYPWSSYRCNALGVASALVRPHPVYEALDRDPQRRLLAYRAIVDSEAPARELDEMRAALKSGGRPPKRGAGRLSVVVHPAS